MRYGNEHESQLDDETIDYAAEAELRAIWLKTKKQKFTEIFGDRDDRKDTLQESV